MVPGSIPGGVTGFFSDIFPSDHTMALGSTQPLVKMSTRNIPEGKGGWCVRLTTSSSRAECHEIWEPKPPGTLWATPGLLRDSFTFYIQYIQISIQYIYTYISIQYTYLFIMQYKFKRITSLVFGMVHLDRTLVALLHKQTLPVSDCWHLMLSKHLALSLILSALSWIVHMLVWVSLTLRHM